MTGTLSPLRSGRITGSRIAAVLGASPYGDRAGVLREMVRQHFGAPDEFTGNIATDHGNDHELDAIAEYEQMRGLMVLAAGDEQEIVIHPVHDFLAVTPDGLVGDDGLVEAKCPWRATYTHVEHRPDYEIQCRLALECTGRRWADFIVWRDGGLAGVSRVNHDPDWLPSVLPDLESYMAEYRETIADPVLHGPLLKPLVDERVDVDWQMAAIDYLEAKAALDHAKRAADTARDALLALAGGKKSRGCGVQVFASERRGSVDYTRIVKEQLGDSVNLDDYRRAGSTVFTVRTTAEVA